MRNRVNPPQSTATRERTARLRQNATDAEARLWFHLRGVRLLGFRFRRQHPLPPYIVDFCCLAAGLIVELDGSQHGGSDDLARDRALSARGFRVLRFWDHDVLSRTNQVLESIVAALGGRTLTPDPSPGGRGETRVARCSGDEFHSGDET